MTHKQLSQLLTASSALLQWPTGVPQGNSLNIYVCFGSYKKAIQKLKMLAIGWAIISSNDVVSDLYGDVCTFNSDSVLLRIDLYN